MQKNNLCKSTIKPFISSHLLNTAYASYLVEAIKILNENRNKLPSYLAEAIKILNENRNKLNEIRKSDCVYTCKQAVMNSKDKTECT